MSVPVSPQSGGRGEPARAAIELSSAASPNKEESPTNRQRITASAFCVSGFLAFYLLSAGPMAGIHRVFGVPGFQRAVEVVYAPVVFLVKRNFEPFSTIMKWYIDLFR